jgi:hypothetical protein
MPRPGNYTDRNADPVGAFFDFRNNVFYNWGGDASGYNADTESLAAYNFVGNAYVPGPDTKKRIAFKEQNPFARAFFADNAMDDVVPGDPWSLIIGVVSPESKLKVALAMPPVTTESWDSAYRRVLSGAGAAKVRDAVDRRIIEGVQARTHRIINSEREVGGWPKLKTSPVPRDSDGDGMPDDYERNLGLNSRNAADGAAVRSSGYTNLEEYLNSLVASK